MTCQPGSEFMTGAAYDANAHWSKASGSTAVSFADMASVGILTCISSCLQEIQASSYPVSVCVTGATYDAYAYWTKAPGSTT